MRVTNILIVLLAGLFPKCDINFISAQVTWNYTEALHASLLFYEAQRAGRLPPDNRVPWRANSMLNDGNDVSRDLTGGYFDGGDLIKFNFPMAFTMTVLAWGGIGYQNAYEKAGEWTNLLAAVRWGTDYFIKCHPNDNELFGQVGTSKQDFAVWGRPEDWEKMGHPQRPAYRISTDGGGADLAGETAAALAAASILFRDSDVAYSNTLLRHAQGLYSFASAHRVLYTTQMADAAAFYNSSGFADELLWAAVWLLRATNNSTLYRTEIDKHFSSYEELALTPKEFSWDSKTAGAQLLLAEITGEEKYRDMVTTFCDYAAHWQPRTGQGMLLFTRFGSLPLATSTAFICLHAANKLNVNNVHKADYQHFGDQQMGIALGDTQGRNYICGFGQNPPIKPTHRGSSCPTMPDICNEQNARFNPGPNYQILTGAMVAGPDDKDIYVDSRLDESHNPVSIAYNAAFTSALAAILGRT